MHNTIHDHNLPQCPFPFNIVPMSLAILIIAPSCPCGKLPTFHYLWAFYTPTMFPYISLMREIILYLSLPLWLSSLSMIISRSSHMTASYMISLMQNSPTISQQTKYYNTAYIMIKWNSNQMWKDNSTYTNKLMYYISKEKY